MRIPVLQGCALSCLPSGNNASSEHMSQKKDRGRIRDVDVLVRVAECLTTTWKHWILGR